MSALHMILCTWTQADPAAIFVDLVGCRALVLVLAIPDYRHPWTTRMQLGQKAWDAL
jgi:hypothetical protein